MGERLGKSPPYVTSHPGQFSFLRSVGWQICTGQNAMMLCGWGVKAGMAHSPVYFTFYFSTWCWWQRDQIKPKLKSPKACRVNWKEW